MITPKIVKQVVENLFSNAIKFSPEGRNIYVSTEQHNGKAGSNISDEGPGFFCQSFPGKGATFKVEFNNK